MIGNGLAPEEAMAAAGVRVRAVQPGTRQRGTRRRLRVLTLTDCAKARPRGYIVKNLIAPGDLIVLFGPPGSGKSVLAPYIAHAIATGRSIFGRRVRRMIVLYVAAEDGAGMLMRAAALRQAHGDTPDLRIIAEPVDLQGEGHSRPADFDAIAEAAEHTRAGLIVLDTLARAFPGLDENDGREMGRAVRLLRDLCTDQRAVMVLHHGAKAGTGATGAGATPRGHGVLNGDADVTLRIDVPEDGRGPRQVVLGKNRNGTTLAPFAFTIRAEELGRDDDGDAITAPVAEETEPERAGTKRLVPTGPRRRALDILHDLLGNRGNSLPPGRMFPADPALRCVPMDDWRAACRARTLSASGEKRAENQAFQRAAEALLNSGHIATGEHEGTRLVWATRGVGT